MKVFLVESMYKPEIDFQSSLQFNFPKHQGYNKLRPVSNQPARLFATANFLILMINNLKLRLTVDQTNTHTHVSSKII